MILSATFAFSSRQMIEKLRNIAIIAHVDHGKTTLVDQLFRQSGILEDRGEQQTRLMDSMELEKERGITIMAKNTAVQWNEYRINIVDTPGHADFGGEVERVLSMVDSVLLLVDAVDGPMPQTRFVTQKAFDLGLKPIVVINKIDRSGSRPDWVLNETFDLFDRLGASDDQLDFPVIYASALQGYSGTEQTVTSGSMEPLFEAIIKYVHAPKVEINGAFQMQVSSLDYSSYTGAIGIGRIQRGQIKRNTPITLVNRDGKRRNARIMQLFGFMGLERKEINKANAGDIIAFTGIENIQISDTLCDSEHVEVLPPLIVDEPTMSMTFQVNTSPFAGKEGKFVTSRQIRERLQRELIHNVALRVEETNDADKFKVSGRGELHLSILIESMRREGYELGVSRPEVIYREVDGELHEPYEFLVIDIEDQHQGVVMEKLGERRAEILNMQPDGKGRIKLEYMIPARRLIGFQSEFITITSGTGLKYQVFDHYGIKSKIELKSRNNGVLVSMSEGKSLGYALFNLQNRGRMFIKPGQDCYEGMIIGIHNRDNDLVVNPMKAKQLTNVRASGTDENVILTPAIKLSLEQALEFITDDELVEITPVNIRLRKKRLKEHERKRASRTS